MSDARRTMTKLAAFAALGTGVVGAAGCQTPPAGFGGMTLPSGRYLQHPPQYFPPDPVFPLQNELNSMQDPEGLTRRGGGVAPAPLAPVQSVTPIPAMGAGGAVGGVGAGGAGVSAPGAGAGMPK